MLGGKVLEHRKNIVPSRGSATAKRDGQAPQPSFTVFSVSLQGFLLALLRPLIVFRDLLSPEQEVDLRASKHMTVHLT